ncbi:hypothetical protein [Dactylosporangium darangshiense]|uniref:hypothetical protein n=1 Tax=Dactylosporangium darangshiense TaxID=579108 RepID=UPI00363CF771
MYYHLPGDQPPIGVVGPDDTEFWTALGEPAAHRHALVIGDRAEPATATVITGKLVELARYLDPIHGPLHHAVVELAANARRGLTHDQLDQLHPAPAVEPRLSHPGEDADPVERITLPHSRLRIPAELRGLRVTSYRALDTRDGQAFNAVLRLGRDAVGAIRNAGDGGASSYDPNLPSRLGYRELRACVAACRTRSGRRPSEEEFLDALVEEYQGTRRVGQATRAGLSALRMLAPLGDGFYTLAVATAQPVRNDADRAELARQLDANMRADDGGHWQIWTGDRWDDLIITPTMPSESE